MINDHQIISIGKSFTAEKVGPIFPVPFHPNSSFHVPINGDALFEITYDDYNFRRV